MRLVDRFHLEPSLIEEIEVFDPPSKFFQDNISNLSLEETQMLVNLLNKYFMKSKAREEGFDLMQHQYQVAQRKYVDLFYFSPIGYFILDRDGQILESNLTATNLLGYPNSSIVSKKIDNFLFEKDIQTVKTHCDLILQGERKGVCEVQLKSKNQKPKTVHLESILWPDELGELTHIRTAVIDISEKKELETKVREQAKMDAIESLVGAIAHDFNNILHSIISNAEYIVQDDNHPKKIDIHLNRILDLSSRAANSISQLLDIGSQSTSHQNTVEGSVFLNQVKSTLEQFVPEQVAVEWRVQDDLCRMKIDQEQIQLILINLFLNSVNAMPDGGMITVDLFKHNPSHKIISLPQLSEDDWLVIRVTDTGQGIASDKLNRLLEPEFNIKPHGYKKGLSLPQARGIMHQHQGHVHVESSVGTGTAVYLFFPIAVNHEEIATLPYPQKQKDNALVNGKGMTILMVEDEIEVGESFREILEYLGFSVMMAVNGRDGLKIYNESYERIELIITDLVMPEMDGESFLKAVQEVNPQAKIIATSGYPLAKKINDLYQWGILGFVQKPFTIQKMSTVLKSALNK